MARSGGRTAPCGEVEARKRLADARAQYDLAEFAGDESSEAHRRAAVSSAVLAGIAAADAACCKALGRASRSDDHHAARALLAQVEPRGSDAARQLAYLLNLKTDSQYGLRALSAQTSLAALRRARALIEFAERVLAR